MGSVEGPRYQGLWKIECAFSRNFCEMGPSSKDVFDHIVTPGGALKYESDVQVPTGERK